MKQILAALIVLPLLFAAPKRTFGSEGHEHSANAIEFRIDSANITLRLDPETFAKDTVPSIVAALNDSMSGSPIYNADIYVLLEKDTGMAGMSHQIGSSSGETNRDAGLDFGEPGNMASMSSVTDVSQFKKLQPQPMAGVYAVRYPLAEQGQYKFTLAVKSIGEKKFPEPLIFGGKILYPEKSNSALYKMIFIIAVIFLSGLVGVWILFQRKSLGLETGAKLNLLDIPRIRKFLKSAWFQPVFQVPFLIGFIVIMIVGIFDVQKGDTNIATLLIWTIWWAAIIFTFVLAGRVWCMMCPVGAIQDWIGRLASLNRDFPKPLRNIYLSSAIFFALTWWDSYSGIVNKPALTAYLLIGFFAVAAVMAVIYKGRTFCRYVCPIGGLIGIYSMFSPLELRNKCLEVCRDHKVKECIKGTEKTYPCPMFVTPMTLDRNNYCNFCSECIKSCSQNNIVIRFRSFAKDLWVSSKGYLDEALLAIVLVGITIIVTGVMVEPWHGWMDTVGKILPFGTLGIASHAAREKATFLIVFTVGSLIISPVILLMGSLMVRKWTGPESPLSLKGTFIQFAYMFIPVGISMHLAHNINHLFKEGSQIVPAVERLMNILAGTGSSEWTGASLMGSESIFWLQMGIFIVMNIFSLYAGYRIAVKQYGDKALRAFIPMALLTVFLMVINAFILGQPMATRHTH